MMKQQYQQQIRAAIRQGDFSTAAEASSTLARLEPDDIDLCLLAADMAIKAERHDQAAEWYAHAAHYYVNRHDIAHAIVMMKSYQKLRPEERGFCRQLFRCCQTIGEKTQCMPLLHVQDRVCMAFRQHELFALISDQAFDELLPALDIRNYEDGEYIARAGDPAEFLYLVAEGGVRPWVSIDGERQALAIVRDSGVCGEVPFLTGKDVRTADLQAVGETMLVCIPYTTLRELVKHYPRVRAQLDEYYQIHLLERQLAHHELFATLSDDQRKRVCGEMKTVHLDAGNTLFQQGSTEELGLYMVRSGWLSVNVEIAGHHQLLYTAKAGDVIGEIAIVEQRRRFSVRAVSDVVLIHWPEEDYRRCYANSVVLRHCIADRLLIYQQAISELQQGKTPRLRFAEQQQYLLKKLYGQNEVL